MIDISKIYPSYNLEEQRAIACHLSLILRAHIKYVSYNDFLGKNSSQNCDILSEIHLNCMQSENAVLVLDNLSAVGDRALILRSNYIINTPLPERIRLIVILITDHDVLY